jgi:hypothetical protein
MGAQILSDLPNPFAPLFYDSVGNKTFILQALCGIDNEWHILDQWNGTIMLCMNTGGRYPSRNFMGSWAPQDPCDKPRVDNIPICNLPQCPELTPVDPPGDGQEWRDPDHNRAVTFTGAVDGEWTNLANWQDNNGRTPARYLPDNTSEIIINASVTSLSDNTNNIILSSITINNASFSIGGGIGSPSISCGVLVCNGTIDRPNPPECDGIYGKITYTTSATFIGGILSGELVNGGGSDAEFTSGSIIESDGLMVGNAIFDSSHNEGTITGDAEFENSSSNRNGGTVEGNAIFRTGSLNTQATVEGNAEFYNDSANSNATVKGNAEFWDTSTNDSYAVVEGSAEFWDSSANQYFSVVKGAATFNDTSSNKSRAICEDLSTFNDSATNDGGICQDDATFNDSAINNGVTNSATFNNSSKNGSSGVINNAAIFNNTSENEGDADGGATFNGSSINDTDGRVLNGATFNTDSINKGEVSSATFNNSSINDTTGTVTGNATFNDSSSNLGTVLGTITCNTTGTCP